MDASRPGEAAQLLLRLLLVSICVVYGLRSLAGLPLPAPNNACSNHAVHGSGVQVIKSTMRSSSIAYPLLHTWLCSWRLWTIRSARGTLERK
jgi:hypothetical protein